MSRIQEKNRARLLEAALSIFSRHGYSGTTLDRIAKAAGMSKSNLLYYFSSKSAIYEASLEYILEVWLGPLRTLNPDGEPAEEMTAYVLHKMEMSRNGPDASRLFANEVISGAPRIRRVLETDLKAIVDDKVTVIESWIAQGKIKPVDPFHLILSIWAVTQHYADFQAQIQALTGKDLNDPAFRKEAEQAVLGFVLSALGLQKPVTAETANRDLNGAGVGKAS